MNKVWESNVQHSDYSLLNCITYLKLTNKVNLKCSHHKKWKLYYVIKVLATYGGNYFAVYKYIESSHCIPSMYML